MALRGVKQDNRPGPDWHAAAKALSYAVMRQAYWDAKQDPRAYLEFEFEPAALELWCELADLTPWRVRSALERFLAVGGECAEVGT
jgi:hypothetical protein